jgi:signal transduction histidine kinase
MKQKLIRLSRRYRRALRRYLTQGSPASLQPALAMGLQAARLGLQRSDVAKIHEAKLATMKAINRSDGLKKRAEVFLAEAMIPMAQTDRSHLDANVDFTQVNEALDSRTLGLAASNQSLKLNIVRCKTVEKDLQKKAVDSKKRLKESNRQQRHLRGLAHRIISTQEERRTEISHELQDEIAQTLLGINVHLLTLKKAAGGSVKGFRKSVASTQRLVGESITLINRFASELNLNRQP